MTDRNQDDLALLLDAAKVAGEVALRHHAAGVESRDKGGGQGPVTEADLEIDALLHARLRAARPDYGWLSEERADTPERLGRSRVFIVDPIDGTRAFAAGQSAFGHALAVVDEGVVVAGVMHMPRAGKTYSATLGGGAFRDGVPIRAGVAEGQGLEGAAMLVHRTQLGASHWRGTPPAIETHFRPSLVYRLCLVAEGRFAGMFTHRPVWEWDAAAGDLIAREAGALVTTRPGPEPRYNNPEPRLPGLYATAAALHPDLRARL